MPPPNGLELSWSGWAPFLESKPCATRDVTGYGEPLWVIVLPNGWRIQVAQRSAQSAGLKWRVEGGLG